MSDYLLMGTVTFDQKDYCFDKWASNLEKMYWPENLLRDYTIVDNSENHEHFWDLKDRLPRCSYVVYDRKLNQSLRSILKESYDVLWALAEDRPLFLLEADVLPPPNALKTMWDFHLENPIVGVIACHVGYPKTPGDDGSKDGFYKYMNYRFTRPEEQKYDESMALDAEKWDRLRPRILEKKAERKHSKKHEIRVANLEGKLYYQGFSGHKARQAYNKALKDYNMPMKLHKIPLLPDNQPVEPDLVNPARAEGLHWGCTLIMPHVHKKIKPRFVDNEDHCPDFYFFKDCLNENIEVWSVPVICFHQHQPWNQELMSNL